MFRYHFNFSGKNTIMLNMKNDREKAIEAIFTRNLLVKQGEKLLVFTDAANEEIRNIAKDVSEIGKRFSGNVTYLQFEPTGNHGEEPPEKVWECAFGKGVVKKLQSKGLMHPLLMKQVGREQLQKTEEIIYEGRQESVQVIIGLSYFSTSHTKFRDMLNRICGVRYASMPLFDEKMLGGAMLVDWEGMFRRTNRIAAAMRTCQQIEIRSTNGTSLKLNRNERAVHADTGIISEPGSFSNLPAGEVFLAPVEGTAVGTLLLEWAPTRKLREPVMLTVKKGEVTNVSGERAYGEFLENKLSERRENRNIAELGIGTNDRASRPDNILESEKILGTIHIALGDNSSFGGQISTPFHQDFVFFHPTLVLIDAQGARTTLLKEGTLAAL